MIFSSIRIELQSAGDMEMGCRHVLQKPKLELFHIIKEAMFIPVKNINFVFFTIITSFPLFCCLWYYEILLQSTLTQIPRILKDRPSFYFSWPRPFDIVNNLRAEFLYRLVQLCLLYLFPLHLLEFISAFMSVSIASKIYKEKQMSLKEMLQKPINKAKLRAAFITSLYAHVLSTCTLLGLIWLVTTYFEIFWRFWRSVVDVFLAVFHGAAFVALLMKYMEWSAAWKMSVVISIVEEKYGTEALSISDYFRRGSEQRGLFLMLFFFGWDFVIRMVGLCWCGIISQVCFLCLCNTMKWMASMVYFYDCKSRVLEKKIDKEMGKEIKGIDEQSSLARE